MTTDNVNIYDRVPADSLMPGDQTIIDGDLILIEDVRETTDPGEVLLIVENLSDVTGDREIPVCYDDLFDLWSM